MDRFLNRICRPARVLSAAAMLLLPAAVMQPFATANAQQTAVRSLSGTVTDKGGAKVKGAVVHLKDTKSLSQRSYITAEDGSFKFGQLSTSTDYEVWADLNGQKSNSKSLSSFDNKAAATIDLKMP